MILMFICKPSSVLKVIFSLYCKMSVLQLLQINEQLIELYIGNKNVERHIDSVS